MSNKTTTDLSKEVIWTEDIHLASALVAGNHSLYKKIRDEKGVNRGWLFHFTQEAAMDVALFEETALSVNAHTLWRLAHEALVESSDNE